MPKQEASASHCPLLAVSDENIIESSSLCHSRLIQINEGLGGQHLCCACAMTFPAMEQAWRVPSDYR
jgi:hypothetical protein